MSGRHWDQPDGGMVCRQGGSGEGGHRGGRAGGGFEQTGEKGIPCPTTFDS